MYLLPELFAVLTRLLVHGVQILPHVPIARRAIERHNLDTRLLLTRQEPEERLSRREVLMFCQ